MTRSLLSFLFLLSLFAAPLESLAAGEETRVIAFPTEQVTFRDDFGEPRGGRTHEGIDIIGKKMMPLYAAVDGRVRSVEIPEPTYGYAIVLEDASGYTYHYIHVNNDTPGTDDGLGGPQFAYAGGIVRGATVIRGQIVGWMGDSGNAEAAGAHLHFEIRRPDRSAVNPYPSLVVARGSSAATPSDPAKTVFKILPGARVVKYAADTAIYLLNDNTKYKIANAATLTALGFSWADVRTIPLTELYATGAPLDASANLVIERGGESVATVSSGYQFTKTVSTGASGEVVRQLQIKLKALGHFTYPEITGYFGAATREAVVRFQRAKGLEQVGFVGPKTRAALNVL